MEAVSKINEKKKTAAMHTIYPSAASRGLRLCRGGGSRRIRHDVTDSFQNPPADMFRFFKTGKSNMPAEQTIAIAGPPEQTIALLHGK